LIYQPCHWNLFELSQAVKPRNEFFVNLRAVHCSRKCFLENLLGGENHFSCCCWNGDQVVSRRVYERAVGRDFLQELLSAEVGNRLFCPSEDFAYFLQVAICVDEQSEVDKAVFSLNGHSGFHQIMLGSGAVREPKRGRVVFDGSLGESDFL
jgi:hypothetical protein